MHHFSLQYKEKTKNVLIAIEWILTQFRENTSRKYTSQFHLSDATSTLKFSQGYQMYFMYARNNVRVINIFVHHGMNVMLLRLLLLFHLISSLCMLKSLIVKKKSEMKMEEYSSLKTVAWVHVTCWTWSWRFLPNFQN